MQHCNVGFAGLVNNITLSQQLTINVNITLFKVLIALATQNQYRFITVNNLMSNEFGS